MAGRTDLEALVYQMSVDQRAMQRQLERATATINSTADKAQRRFDRLGTDMGRGLTGGFRAELRNLVPTLAAAFSVGQVIRYADSYTTLQNRLRAAGLEGERLATIEAALYASANRNGQAVDVVATMYQRVLLARQNLRATDQQLLDLTDGVTAALRVQGVTAEAARGPLLQLGQALGAGTVRAEELNSLLEGTPVILQAAAAGSARFSGDLSAMAAAIRRGEVSSQELFRSLLAGLPAIEERAASLPPTVAMAMQTLNNELGRLVGQTDQGLSATERMASALMMLADNLDVVVTAAGVAVTIVGTRYVAAQLASAAATGANAVAQISLIAAISNTSRAALIGAVALRGLGAAAMFFVTNPIGIAITAVAVALAFLAMRGGEADDVQQDLNASVSRTERALDKYRQAAQAAASATAENAEQARRNAAAMRMEAEKAIQSALALRQRTAALRDEAVARLENIQAIRSDPTNADARTRGALGGSEAAMIAQVARARQAAADALEALLDSRKELYNIDHPALSGGGGTREESSDGARRSGRSGPSAEDLAARQAMLRLEQQLELARAANNEREVARIQEQIDLIRLTQQLEEAGFEDAAFAAEAHLAALGQVRAEEERLAALSAEKIKRDEGWAEAQQRVRDQLADRLEIEQTLARLRGDVAALFALEREAFLQERINQLLTLRPDLTDAARRAQAEDDWSEQDAARAEGARRESAQAGARAFVEVLQADNIWEAAGRRFRDAAWDGVEQLLSIVLQQIMGSMAASGGGRGGGWVGSLIDLFGGGFGGKRAAGGPVSAGKAYLVGEKRPEIFVPGSSGTILPDTSALSALSGLSVTRGAVVNQTFQVNAQGAILAAGLVAELKAHGTEMATLAGATAYSRARLDIADEAERLAGNRLGYR